MIKEYITKYGTKLYVEDNGCIYDENHKLLRQTSDSVGYVCVSKVDKDGIGRKYLVHRLVAAAFIGDVEGMQVHHIDQVVDNNNVENLQILTRKEHDNIHKWKHPRYRTCVVCGKIFEPYESKRSCAKVCSKACKRKLDKLNASKRKRPIIQLSLDGEEIKVWSSARDIENELGYSGSDICKCCKHKINTYKGYRWEYFDESIQN